METKSVEQKVFKGIVTDINEIDVNIAEGALADNFNGRVAQIGPNNFSWSSVKGTSKAFVINPKAGGTDPALGSKANIYMFDDRMFAENPNKTLGMKIPNSSSGTYEYILNLSAYKTDFSGLFVNPYSQIEILVKQKIETDSSGNKSEYKLILAWRIGTSSAFASSITYTLISYPNILYKMHETLAYYINTYIISSIISGPFYGLVAQSFEVNGQTFCELRMANTVLANLVVKNKFGLTTETPTYFCKNRFGFGAGSKFNNLGYPNAPQYPVPGSDYEINPLADDMPWGLTSKLREKKQYTVFSGVVEYQKDNIPSSYTTGGNFSLDPNLEQRVTSLYDYANPYLYFKQDNGVQTNVVENEPNGWGYGLTTQLYKAAISYKDASYGFCGTLGVSKTKALLFLSIGNEYTKICLIDTTNKKIEVTTLIETDEDLNINQYSKIRGFAKYDNENNLRAYWTSGVGHLRVLNLNDIPTSSFDFNTRLIKPCNFGEINISRVSKSGGGLLVGSYQFCHELSIDGAIWTRAGQHTDPIMIGQSYYGAEGLIGTDVKTATYAKPNEENEPTYRGANLGTKTTEAINVLITNIDKRYNYIRVFSIESISGSASKVINNIYEGKLKEIEKYSFSCTHSGSTNIVEGNLNISEITQRKIVPLNVKWISQINNRMVICNYSTDYKIREDLTDYKNSNLSIIKTRQCIGSDTDITKLPGHKNWLNQYQHRTLPVFWSHEFAWVYIDEYGNESEPTDPFNIELDFRKYLNAQHYTSYNHPATKIDWSKNFIDIAGNWDSAYAKANQDSIFLNETDWGNHQLMTNYLLYSYGTNLKIPNFKKPSWAQKAILVEKKQSSTKKIIVSEGFGIYDGISIKMGFMPDAEGYNVYDNYSFKQGDKIRITAKIVEPVDGGSIAKVGKYKDPTTYIFNYIDNYFYGLVDGDTEYLFEIKSFAHKIYPKKDERGAKDLGGGNFEWLMPSDTINMTAFEIMFDGTPDIGSNKLVKFQIERESDTIQEDIQEFVNTGFSIDLKSKYNEDYQRAFIGNSFISTCHQIITMRTAFYYAAYRGINLVTYVNEDRYVPVQVLPLITKFNMAMADDSMFPFYRMNPVVNNYTCYGFRQINRDYAVQNSLNNYKFISQDFLKPRKVFNNVMLYSNASVIGQTYDNYADINPLNLLEVQSDYGEIVAIFELRGFLMVQQQYGFRKYVIDAKEFVQTTNGSLVTLTAGGFISSIPSNISDTFGSIYPGVKGEKGIYFISSQYQMLCFATEQKIDLISNDMGFQKLLNENLLVEDDRNTNQFNGIDVFKDKNESLIYFYLVSRPMFSVFNFTTTVITVYKSVIIPEVNGVYCFLYLEAGGYYLKYIQINSIVEASIYYELSYATIALVPYSSSLLVEGKLYLAEVKKPSLLAFNELQGILEFRSSNLRNQQPLEKLYIDSFFGNQINIEYENSNKFYNVQNGLGGNHIPLNTRVWDRIYQPGPYTTLFNPNLQGNNTIDFKLSLPNTILINSKLYFLSTNKEFHFVKGVKYTFSFLISFPTGGGIGLPLKLFFGPTKDLLDRFTTPIGFSDYMEKAYPVGGTGIKQYSFVCNESFVSPITLYAENFRNTSNGLLMRLFWLQFDYEEQFESYPELYVGSNSSKMISYDNLILSTGNENTPDRIEIYSKEQEETLTITSPLNYGKQRLRQFQMAIPKLNSKERLRSTYFKIKFVYVSNEIKNMINALESIIRSL